MTNENLVHGVPSAPRLLEDRLRLSRRGDVNRLVHVMVVVLANDLLLRCHVGLSQELLPYFLAHTQMSIRHGTLLHGSV